MRPLKLPRPAADALLALDTTQERLSLALEAAGRVRVLERLSSRPHDETLFPRVRSLLSGSGLGLRDLAGVAAASGPGRFTGIRVGLTFASILAGTLGIPVAAVSKFEALASRLRGTLPPRKAGPLHAVFGSGVEFYLQALELRGGSWAVEGEPYWSDAREGAANLRRRLRGGTLCGPGAGALAALTGLGAWPGPLSMEPVSAAALLVPAREKLLHAKPSAPRPLYLKPARFEAAA